MNITDNEVSAIVKEVIAKVRMNNNVSPNDKVKLYIDTEKPHIFDKETHKLICD